MEPDVAAPTGVTETLAPAVTLPTDAPKEFNPRSAGAMLAELRWKKHKEQQPGAPAGEVPPVEPPAEESGDEPGAAPPVEATGETQVTDPPAAPAPIEPPRSWSKEARDRWSKLDPDTQRYLLDRDREDTTAVRNAQNEAAEARKVVDTEKAQLEQARQHYEQALPALLQALHAEQAGEFADIRSMADVEQLARTDWPRYVLWDARQKKIAAVQQQVSEAQMRQASELQTRWSDYVRREDGLFRHKVPEFADQKVEAQAMGAAVGMMKDIGFKEDELVQLWNGQAAISLRDHRIQLLIRDGVRYREAQAKAKVATKQVPPVAQRPGTAQPPAAQHAAAVESLTQRLDKSGSLKDAAALIRARRQAR